MGYCKVEKACSRQKLCKVIDYCHFAGKYRSAANIIFVIQDLMCQTKFLTFFTMDQTPIIILS